MDKTDIVSFLEQKRRGVYNVIVNQYWSVISSTPVNLALTLISSDLEKSTGRKVELKYVSLAQAVSKAKANLKEDRKETTSLHTFQQNSKGDDSSEFKDAHELAYKEIKLGGFTVKKKEDGTGKK